MGYKAFMGYFRGYSNDLKRFELDQDLRLGMTSKKSECRMGTRSQELSISEHSPDLPGVVFFLSLWSPDLRGLFHQFSSVFRSFASQYPIIS